MNRTHRRTGIFVGALAALTIGALALTVPTGASYTDQTHARTEAIGVEEVAPPTPPGPATVTGLSSARMVDTGLGLADSGDVYMWGRTDLGIGGNLENPGTQRGPTRVGFPAGTIAQVSGQIYGANALDAEGYVWGVAGTTGQDDAGLDAKLPDGAPQRITIGTSFDGDGALLDGAVQMSTTEQAGAAIRGDGTVWVWGKDGYGGNQADGASQLEGLPDPSVDGNQPVSIKGMYRQFVVMLENGDIYAWGGSTGGSLPGDVASSGTAYYVDALAPWMHSQVADGAPYITAVDGGINLGTALLSDGTVLSWGSTKSRIADRPSDEIPPNMPGPVPGLTGIVSLQAGYTGVAMLDGSGQLWGYGATDDYGKFPTTPAVIDTDVVQYAAGQGYYLWQKSDGTFWGRGYNPAGAIGTPIGTIQQNRPVSYDMTVVSR